VNVSDGYYILDGHEPVMVSPEEWRNWRVKNDEQRTVAKDQIGEVCVSTVFLGIDDSFGSGPPILFESMVFGGRYDEDMDRYETWEEAEAGHRAMVEKVKADTPPGDGCGGRGT